MKSAISNWIYLIYGYSIEIQISDIVYYKVCSIWYTKHFIFERSLASQNCFVALWHLWIVVLTLSTSHIEEVLRNCLMWENRKHAQNYNDQYYNNHYYNYICTPQLLLRDKFCCRTNFAKGKILLKGKFLPKDNFCWRKNFAKGKFLLKEKFC